MKVPAEKLVLEICFPIIFLISNLLFFIIFLTSNLLVSRGLIGLGL